jgi:hypothetical protein
MFSTLKLCHRTDVGTATAHRASHGLEDWLNESIGQQTPLHGSNLIILLYGVLVILVHVDQFWSWERGLLANCFLDFMLRRSPPWWKLRTPYHVLLCIHERHGHNYNTNMLVIGLDSKAYSNVKLLHRTIVGIAMALRVGHVQVSCFRSNKFLMAYCSSDRILLYKISTRTPLALVQCCSEIRFVWAGCMLSTHLPGSVVSTLVLCGHSGPRNSWGQSQQQKIVWWLDQG